MDSGALNLMHRAVVANNGGPFVKVTKKDGVYFKVLDYYLSCLDATNLRNYEKTGHYTVGSIAAFWNTHDKPQTAYNTETLDLGVDLIPRPHRRALRAYLHHGISDRDLVFDETVKTRIFTSRDFDDTSIYDSGDVEMKAVEDIEPMTISGDFENKRPTGDILNATTSAIRDLSNDLTADRIAQLATKVKLNKSQKERGDRSLLDTDISVEKAQDAVDNFIKYGTRVYRNRNSKLNGRGDYSFVIGLVSSRAPKPSSQPSITLPKPPVAPNLQQSSQQRSTVGYSRYHQEFFENAESDEFQIQTGMSFHGTNFKQLNRATLSNAAKPIAAPTGRHPGSGGIKRPYPTQSSSAMAAAKNAGKKTSRTPIIIIPASETALLSMYNARDILQDLRYVTAEERKHTVARKENELLIHHRKENGQTVPYRVIDSPQRLTPEEWDRVVAVFAQGPAWQFKGWHWNGNPTDIFSHVCGFHLKFEDTKLDSNISKWNVEVFKLSKTKRHLDKATFIRLWNKIEQFIVRNKPSLRY